MERKLQRGQSNVASCIGLHTRPDVCPTYTLPQCPPPKSDIDDLRAAVVQERWVCTVVVKGADV
eukprot:1139833-Pelagomonas_calceolata.AAC.4